MAQYQRVFTTARIGQLHEAFHLAIAEAQAVDKNAVLLRRRGIKAPTVVGVLPQLLKAYAQMNRDLDELAVASAADAKKKIQAYLKLTAKRPAAGDGQPHINSLITCRPLHRFSGIATGEVGVADEAVLDKAVDPLYPGAGEYWRAQEFGSTAHVGRIIRGYFYGPGFSNPTPPLASPPSPLQPLFVPSGAQRAAYNALGFQGGGGKQGGTGNIGEIHNPIQARHFISRGANDARRDWRAGIEAISDQVSSRLLRILP